MTRPNVNSPKSSRLSVREPTKRPSAGPSEIRHTGRWVSSLARGLGFRQCRIVPSRNSRFGFRNPGRTHRGFDLCLSEAVRLPVNVMRTGLGGGSTALQTDNTPGSILGRLETSVMREGVGSSTAQRFHKPLTKGTKSKGTKRTRTFRLLKVHLPRPQRFRPASIGRPKNDFLASMCPKSVPDTNGTRFRLLPTHLELIESQRRILAGVW